MTDQIRDLEKELEELKAKLAEARKAAPRGGVSDYEFMTLGGPIKLSELFSVSGELLVVHNMGKSCPYCTLWADGLNGLVSHFENRAGFAVCSPDTPQVQREFAAGRGWKFEMVSDESKTFTTDMGFWKETDGFWPGISGFSLEDGQIYRTGTTVFGPGDDFCGIWPAMELLGGDKGWEPKYKY